jgi:FixJ family two-component response regulator
MAEDSLEEPRKLRSHRHWSMRQKPPIARRPPHQSQSTPQRQRTRNTIANRATVLIVDDDPSALRALARLIRSAEYLVLTFDRPSALLASEIPMVNACMLIDIELPEMNGFQLYYVLAESGRGLPTIMMTGRDTLEMRCMVDRASVPVLFKPIDMRTLFEAIKRAFARPNIKSK